MGEIRIELDTLDQVTISASRHLTTENQIALLKEAIEQIESQGLNKPMGQSPLMKMAHEMNNPRKKLCS